MEISSYRKTGYLNSEFRLFYILDQDRKAFDLHYHDFHKIMIFLRGNVSYFIEGKQYDLTPGDVILVRAGEIHRPVIHDDTSYERIILYISPAFFERSTREGNDLFQCFERSASQQSSLIRFPSDQEPPLTGVCQDLARSFQSQEFAAALYQQLKFTEFLILLNRRTLAEDFSYTGAMTANPVVQKILKYINDHITEEELSIDTIAQASFLNRSYLMHLFKEETGCTIGKYITEKRLFLARGLIAHGMAVTDACYRSGFKNYTAFYYACKNKYGASPARVRKSP